MTQKKEKKMKKLVVACSLVATTAVLLVTCQNKKNVKNNNKTTQVENKKMTRTKTASGLEYEILTEGTGISPKSGQEVVVHYTGWLNVNGEPGKKFDSSVDRGTPFIFPIGMGYVIQGWDEGVITMKMGEKRRLYIPSQLGYGTRGAGAAIPANANLIFDVELLNIQ
jgi:peptidylprolyl isomerase